jgi:hypothetical protein
MEWQVVSGMIIDDLQLTIFYWLLPSSPGGIGVVRGEWDED